jgi:DNA-binding MltR family transcriptional regulator
MKRVKFINILLIMMFSFSILHSFVLEDAHHHHTYEKEWSGDKNTYALDDDIQEMHDNFCEFHHSYILVQNSTVIPNLKLSSSPLSNLNSYTYYKIGNFLKPPIS